MLRIENLKKFFGKNVILNKVNLKVNPSEIKVIMGLNGSGKSTFLKIIAGLIQPDEGQIFINDKDITKLDPEDRNIGYVPQHPALFPHLTVKENIYYSLKNKRGSKKLADQLVKMLDLEPYLEKKTDILSGGYKSRVSLARALVSQPEVILLDEPLSDLDLAIKEKLLEKFKEVLKFLNIPVIYVTHDPVEAQIIGDTFSVLIKGKIKEINSIEEAHQLMRKDL
ncbi:ABC transporter ATP-binding protein [Thermodesulfobacterium hydrogeniphilum]|uniref:ABC transporter ATP-binding protein n=1 Tax=Thermodesulfobacterium hydrogeniphilum TaxID=161156 RepID=UPI0005706C1D|nr:ABC transporter ATP-binding protein [Thermodesulfobacterium hydrogeniphilum]